jgi:ubiquinone/menaquinone biosynthesis C-methylase UbiE
MPDEAMWQGFFDPPRVLASLGLTPEIAGVADLGCGYGTFSIEAAKIARGPVHAIDIDPDMVAATRTKAKAEGLANVVVHLRDFVADGTGLPDETVDYVMIFNILHAEKPERLLGEAARILVPGGLVAAIHWVSDRPTPRGPSLQIRPTPEACVRWMAEAGFELSGGVIDLPPYHFGLVGQRPGLMPARNHRPAAH